MADKDKIGEFVSEYQKEVTRLFQKYGKDLLLEVKKLDVEDLESIPKGIPGTSGTIGGTFGTIGTLGKLQPLGLACVGTFSGAPQPAPAPGSGGHATKNHKEK